MPNFVVQNKEIHVFDITHEVYESVFIFKSNYLNKFEIFSFLSLKNNNNILNITPLGCYCDLT